MDEMSNERAKCLEVLKEICEEKLDQLFEVWKVVGHADVSARATVVCTSVQQLLMDMLEEESEYQDTLARKIEDLLKEASELCRVSKLPKDVYISY